MTETYEVVIRLTGQNDASAVINQVKGQLDRIDDSAASTASSMNGMGMAIKTAVAGFVINQVRQFSEEMYRVGTETRIAIGTFTQLAGGADQAAAHLDRLRAATGGVVTDLTLAQGASKFLSMGLAENGDELARLTEMAVKLGGAMGYGTSEALDSFALLLSNESILRLDTFGISAERVRTRIEELMASGEALNRSDAFRMAVMEIGGQALDRLGGAADAASTPLSRLQTRFENLTNAIAEFLARGVDAGAMLVDIAGAVVSGNTVSDQTARTEAERVQSWATVIAGQIIEATGEIPPDTFADMQGLQDFVANVLRYGVNNIDTFNPDQILTAGFGATIPNAANLPTITYYQGLISYIEEYNAQLEESARLSAEARGEDEARARALAILSDTIYGAQDLFGRFGIVGETMGRGFIAQGYDNDYAMMLQQLGGVGAAGMDRRRVGGLALYTAEEAQRAAQLVQEYDAMLIRLEAAHDAGLISDTQFERITSSREQMAQMADEIERGAAAFQNITLAQALGQSGGGMFGELGDQVLQALQGSGLDDDQIQLIRDTLDLTSGRETEASLMLRDEVAPLLAAIAETYGGTELIVALQRVQDTLLQGQLTGMSDTQLALAMQGAVGYQFSGTGTQTFTVRPGDTVSGLMGTTGLSYEEIMTAAGITDPRRLMPGTYGAGQGALVPIDLSAAAADAPVVADSMTTIEDTTAGARDNVDSIQATLDTIAGTSYTINLDLVFHDPAGVLKILGMGMGGFAQAMATATRDSGGVPPGVDPRGSQPR